MSPVALWLCAVPLALGLTAAQLAVVARLPEPADGPSVNKSPYAVLVTRRSVAGLGLGTVVLTVLTAAHPPSFQAVWLVMASAVLVTVWVDWRTTWLPRSLTLLCGVFMLGALASSLLVGASSWVDVGRAALGGAAEGGFFWTVWRFTRGGLGLGDARLGVLLGAATGLVGLDVTARALVLGTVAGAVAGLVTASWRRRHPCALGAAFAYGPWLYLGAWLAFLSP